MDSVQLMTFEDWENQHKEVTRKARKKLNKERCYFRKQKLYGVGVVLFGVAISVIADVMSFPDISLIGNAVSLCGLYVAISQKHLIA